MLGADPDMASSALRLWIAAGSAALLVFICAMAFRWTQTRTLTRVGIVVVGSLLGATLAWAFLNGASTRDQSAERLALEGRAAALNAQALAPGSPLACLDALAGENVEAACEKSLFATPATTATAVSYVAARLTLLADIAAYSKNGGGNIDSALLPLRRALEADRFGFVAHTLAVRDGCSSESCKALSLLHDPSRVRANLSGQTLDRYLDRYVAVWGQAPDTPVADATSGAPLTNQPGAPGQRKVVVDIDFPTAASIPPVSIMNPEPKGPVVPGAAVAAAVAGGETSAQAGMPLAPAGAPAAASAATPTKQRPRKQAANPQPQAAAAAPAPAATDPGDPVWAPGAATAAPTSLTLPAAPTPRAQ